MNEPPPMPEPSVRSESTAAEAAPRTSLLSRLLNVFATPGEVFQEIKTSPSNAANWLVPVAFAAIIGAIGACIILSQPAILQKIREQQQQKLDKMVSQGKMDKAQETQALDVMSNPVIFKALGSAGAVVASFVRVFWWALVLWLLARKVLRSDIPFMKATEVAGMTMMISVLGGIVAVLLSVNLGKMFASPGPALLVSDFNSDNKMHLALGAANVFNFWFVAVMAAGLARLASVPYARALPVLAIFWFLQELLLIGIGAGTMAQ